MELVLILLGASLGALIGSALTFAYAHLQSSRSGFLTIQSHLIEINQILEIILTKVNKKK